MIIFTCTMIFVVCSVSYVKTIQQQRQIGLYRLSPTELRNVEHCAILKYSVGGKEER